MRRDQRTAARAAQEAEKARRKAARTGNGGKQPKNIKKPKNKT